MDYAEAVNTLERLRRARPKLGTETTADLLDRLGNPHEEIPAVQVAGSNGKGSTARVTERILREAGLDVGVYTSPDLNDLRSRIQVRGQKIPRHRVAAFVDSEWPHVVEQAADGDQPTFFEVFTCLALWQFAHEDVDVAVLEVGIGGRYDATSVVDPVASAVTSVSLEHTDIIGSTVSEIARDKGHVAPADRPLVTAATGEALATLREETDVITVGVVDDAESGGSEPDVRVRELERPERAVRSGMRSDQSAGASVDSEQSVDVSVDSEQSVGTGVESTISVGAGIESTVSVVGPDWEVETQTPLLGSHQAANVGVAATLARQVGEALDRPVSPETVAAGVQNVTVPGRFEVVDREPLTVLDGAHNPAAVETLARTLDSVDYETLHLVFGAMHDKDHAEMCRALPAADSVHLVEPALGRAETTEMLRAVFERETGRDTAAPAVFESPSVLAGVERASQAADADDCVVVTGSLYTIAEARDRWTRTPRVVEIDSANDAEAAAARADVPAAARTERAESFVHRTIRLHARRETARELETTLLSLGGTAAVSGIETADQHVELLLGGTLPQLRGLVDRLESGGVEHAHLARQLRQALAVTDDGGHPGASDADAEGATERGGSTGTDTTVAPPWQPGTAVMGILNVTPDSFHDGGEYDQTDAAVARAEQLIAEGAAIVDVGGESTRPGAEPTPAATERERVVPVIERLDEMDVFVSVDTRKASVAAAALRAGADMVNDVTGLSDVAMRRVVAEWDVPVALMHSLSAPVDPDRRYEYDDVVDDVLEQLRERLLLAERAGIDRSQVVVDPGLGFGKRPAESFQLLDRLGEFHALGTPVLIGHSHKSMLADVAVGADDESDRLHSTVAATALAAERGADVIRVHDVAENVAAVETAERTDRRRDG
jgi:dihydropteroate synthase